MEAGPSIPAGSRGVWEQCVLQNNSAYQSPSNAQSGPRVGPAVLGTSRQTPPQQYHRQQKPLLRSETLKPLMLLLSSDSSSQKVGKSAA